MSLPERKLGTWPIFVIAVSAMTPLTVVAGALPLGYGQVGEKGIPVAYMLVAVVLGVFAVGLAAMARHVPNSGAFYAYASIGLSRPVGVGTAFVALLAYNAMQIGLYGAFGVAAHNALAIFGVEVSWIVLALVGWVVIAALGRLDIDLNARILTVLIGAEVLVVIVFDAVMIGNPAGGTVTFDTLNPALIASAGGVSLLVAAIAGMVGFEAPLVYAAEARDPRRTVARAIGLTLLVAAVLYGGTAWAMSVVAGPDRIVAVAGDHLDDLFFFLPAPYLSSVVVDLGRIFFATSLFAAMLAFHHTVARYVLTVAREGVLPSSLARTRRGVPVAASLAQSALALVVLLIFAAAVWNPTTDLFFFGTVSGGLGVLVLMTIASIAVLRFFRRDGHGETRWRRAIAPWIAAVFLSLVLLLTIAFFSDLLGSDNLLKVWAPTLLFLLALVAGIVWGRRLKRERPEVYAVIGTGRQPLTPGEAPDSLVDDGVEAGPVQRGGAGPPSATGPSASQPSTWAGTERTAGGDGIPSAEGSARSGGAERAAAEEGARSAEGSARSGGAQRGAGGDRARSAQDAEREAERTGGATRDFSPLEVSGGEGSAGSVPGGGGSRGPVAGGTNSDEAVGGGSPGKPVAGDRVEGGAAGTAAPATQSPGAVPAPRKPSPRKRTAAGGRPGGRPNETGQAGDASVSGAEEAGTGTPPRSPSPRKRTAGRNRRQAAGGSGTGAGEAAVPGETPEGGPDNGVTGTRGAQRRVPRPRNPPSANPAPDSDVPDDPR